MKKYVGNMKKYVVLGNRRAKYRAKRGVSRHTYVTLSLYKGQKGEARCESFYAAFSLCKGPGIWKNFKLWDLEKF